MTILKALKHKYCLILGTCHKYAVQFTDLTPTIYWYAKRAKLTKAMFVYLPVSETQCIIYRPDLLNSQATREKLMLKPKIPSNMINAKVS